MPLPPTYKFCPIHALIELYTKFGSDPETFSHFAVPSATVECIKFHEDRKLDKAQMLRFATCQSGRAFTIL